MTNVFMMPITGPITVPITMPLLAVSTSLGCARSPQPAKDGRSAMVSFCNPPTLPSSPAYSHAALLDGGRVLYVSGQQALDAHGQLVGRDDFARQAAQVFANVTQALAAAGADATDVLGINTHYVNRADLPAYRDARAAFFAGRTAPAPTSTTVQVSGLVAEGALLEVGVTALVPALPAVAGSQEPIS